ncbi:MAG: 50S ribosome-binding GTPase [Pirellulales bacterium]|nr:50S ribosome-binding GTPase [Pirellulales bacterium]
MPNDLTRQLVLLTPPGRGAVATVLLEGPDARDAVQEVFQAASNRPLDDYAPEQLIYGRLGPPPGEEVVLHCRSAEQVEVHCHGGTAAVGRLEKIFAVRGFAAVDWQSWIPSQEPDPIAAAARLALADARTAQTAAILLDQYHGALRREFETIKLAICPHPSSLIPHPSLHQRLETLRTLIPLGRHLTSPWQVVLAGRPNVGKSCLLNALVGYGRAIVHEEPGTTRDAVTVTTALDGWPVELCDTAGLCESTCPVERAGVELARQKMQQSDLTVLVFDAAQSWTPVDQALDAAWPQALRVHNKCDLPRSSATRPSGLSVSALTGQGIEVLAQTIAKRLVPHPPPPGAAVPFTEAHFRQIEEWERL